MSRSNPWLIAAVVALLALLSLAAVAARRSSTASQLAEKQVTAANGPRPEVRCTSGRTYDSIKLELFRSAAQTRGSDQAAFDRISAYSVVRMERPLLTSFDRELGTIRCSGRLLLDLPPGLAVVGGRRTLSADIDYVLQPAADGSGDVVMLEGDAPIMIPLATLARTGRDTRLASSAIPPVGTSVRNDPPQGPPRPDIPIRETLAGASKSTSSPTLRTVPNEPPTASRTVSKKPVPPKALPTSPPAQVQTAKARPSFNCRYARTKGEKAICNNAPLASLDRQMASKYYRSVASADARQRQLLAATRNAFLHRRDQCGSEACIANSYHERMREIADITGR